MLSSYKPFERLDSRRDHLPVFAAAAGQDERLRQPRIRVRKTLFEPMPGFVVAAFVDIEEAIGECVANALDGAVARESVEIGLQSENAECPCARAREL